MDKKFLMAKTLKKGTNCAFSASKIGQFRLKLINIYRRWIKWWNNCLKFYFIEERLNLTYILFIFFKELFDGYNYEINEMTDS